MTTLRQLGEREIIRRLAAMLGTRDDVAVGIGDDVAVVRVEGTHTEFLLTSDAVIEGVHFLRDDAPELVGRKAIGRVLSDFAAAGGEPAWALVDLVAPADAEFERIERIYKGASALADKYGLSIVGGDTAMGNELELHVFGVGQTPRKSALLRSGAKPGDVICVTGALGGSRLGHHLDFEPRVGEGLWLRESGWVHAMIDVSDGLVTDLGHILEASGVGAEIDAGCLPVSDDARRAGGERSPLQHALLDGEDYELLFTIAGDRRAALESSWSESFDLPCTAIGRITQRPGELVLVGEGGRRELLRDGGYEHFRAGG